MPVISQKTYSHPLRYSADELSLHALRRNERRSMPGAYAPKTATIFIERNKARLEIDYSVRENAGGDVQIAAGLKIGFGKFTRKVLSASFEYPELEVLLAQILMVSASLRVQQNLVPQDSIKRNYQMVAEGLNLMRTRIEEDLHMLKVTLDQTVPDSDSGDKS